MTNLRVNHRLTEFILQMPPLRTSRNAVWKQPVHSEHVKCRPSKQHRLSETEFLSSVKFDVLLNFKYFPPSLFWSKRKTKCGNIRLLMKNYFCKISLHFKCIIFYQKKYQSSQVKTKCGERKKNAFLFSPLMLLTEACSHKIDSLSQADISQQKGFSFCNCVVKPSQRLHVFICTYHINEKYWNPGRWKINMSIWLRRPWKNTDKNKCYIIWSST